jgi:hypothetical protein
LSKNISSWENIWGRSRREEEEGGQLKSERSQGWGTESTNPPLSVFKKALVHISFVSVSVPFAGTLYVLSTTVSEYYFLLLVVSAELLFGGHE